MHATTTSHRQERRGSGPYRPRALFVYTAFVLAAVLALAPGASPESHAQPRPSHGASALAPPRLRLGHGRGLWARRHRAVPTGLERLATQMAEPMPPACSPSLFAAPYTGLNEGTTNSTLPLRPGSRISAVMLFVDFADHRAAESTTRLYSRLVPRSRAWFAEVSYGRVHLSVTAIHHWLRMPRSLSAYGLANGISWPEHRDYIADAIAAADSEIDFSRYQVVYVVAAKGSKIERSPAFQAYPGSGIDVDGSEVRYGATFFDDTRADARYAANVLSHETGHILGLPDLYDVLAADVPDPTYRRLFRFAGGWDMMSWNEPGAHFLAWEKWKLGWLDPSQLTCLNGPGSVTTTITPLERAGGLKAVVVPIGSSSAYVVEARRRIGQDARLCKEGVLVYTVDATVRSGNGPVRVRAAEQDTSTDLRDRCGPLYNAPFATKRGRVARFEDASAGLSVKVLASESSGYRVRVTRAPL